MSKFAVLIALVAFVPGSIGLASEQAAIACPGPGSVPPPRLAVADERCPALAAVDAALTRADEPSEDELESLRSLVRRSIVASPEGCTGALSARIAEDTTCGAAYDAVAVRLVTTEAVDPAVVAGVLLRPSPCQWKLVSALREATTVDPSVLVAVGELTHSADDDVRRSAWMTYGTLDRIARDAGETQVAACGERQLSRTLASTTLPEEKRVLLAAAGNAGCTACRGELDRAMGTGDVQSQRIAVAGHRFLEDRADVDQMCGALRNHVDATVRGAAAFALRHRTSSSSARIQCLYDAAISDPVDEVGRDAVSSIEELARLAPDDDRTLAIGALARLTRHASGTGVRAQSMEALRGFASDEALAELQSATD